MPHQVELIIRMMFLTTGLICLGYALAIGVRGKAHLIAGYDAEKVADTPGLCRFLGVWTALVGSYCILYPCLLRRVS